MTSKFVSHIKTILVLFFWSIYIYKIYVDYDYEYLMDKFIHHSLIIIACIVSFIAINSDISKYKQQRKMPCFLSTGATFLCVIGFLLTSYFLKRQDQTPTVLYAAKHRGLFGTTTSLDFRENNTYKFGWNGFMSSSYSRGNYEKKDSIIYLDNIKNLDELVSNRLVLRTILIIDSSRKKKRKLFSKLPNDKYKIDTTTETFLFQLDNNGNVIDSAKRFRVVYK